jgi:RimJ/RimL family protein N-acetyltransferase
VAYHYMPPLETERLALRPFCLDDLETIHHILDIDLQFAENNESPGTIDDRRSWLEWTIASYDEYAKLYQPPYGERAVVRQADDTLVGACGLVPALGPFALLTVDAARSPAREETQLTPEVGLFWALASSCWGQGYATEAAGALIRYAFQTLNLRRIIATTEYANLRSQAVMRRLGMRLARNPFPDPPWFQVVGTLENQVVAPQSGQDPS